MADGFRIDVDTSEVLRQLDQFGEDLEQAFAEAALATGFAVAAEARDRLARQTHGTGQTAENITISTSSPRAGRQAQAGSGPVFVFVRPRNRPANLPVWLEFGTINMEPRPFLIAAAHLEEGPHRRRMAAAAERAIRRAGGGS
jgi:hypothetical protein